MNEEISKRAAARDDAGPVATRAWAAPTSSAVLRYLGALAIVAASTMTCAVMGGRFELADLAMIYLLGSVVTAVAFGLGPAIAASLLGVLAFNFGFVPPRFTFQVAEPHYVVTFGVMLAVSISTAMLTARLRRQLAEAKAITRRTAALYRLSHELVSRSAPEDVLRVAVDRIGEVIGARVTIGLPVDPEGFRILAGDPGVLDGEAAPSARRAFESGQITGLENLGGRGVLHVPLEVGGARFGVLSVAVTGHEWVPERFQLLRMLAGQVTLALERCRLAEDAHAARVHAGVERSRSALLSSVSHDLRTPLAAITGAATSLRDGSANADEHTRHELADTIASEAIRLDRLIGNILEMTRLESESLRLRRQWHSLEELVGVALRPLEASLAARPIHVTIAADLPLVSLDDLLFEQVLRNLLDNANKYSPQGQPIELRASLESRVLRVDVLDRGPGLGPDAARVFEKFHRGAASAGIPGSGLGLAICQAIVEAHAGTITARDREGGGAVFTVRLPQEGSSPTVEQEDPAPLDVKAS